MPCRRRTASTSVGLGIRRMASTFFKSGRSPLSVTTWPKKVNCEVWNMLFSLLSFRPFSSASRQQIFEVAVILFFRVAVYQHVICHTDDSLEAY